jgi:hypothetical protein
VPSSRYVIASKVVILDLAVFKVVIAFKVVILDEVQNLRSCLLSAQPLRRASAAELQAAANCPASLVDGVIRRTRPPLCALGHTRASRLLPLTFKVVILTLQVCHSERSEESP